MADLRGFNRFLRRQDARVRSLTSDSACIERMMADDIQQEGLVFPVLEEGQSCPPARTLRRRTPVAPHLVGHTTTDFRR